MGSGQGRDDVKDPYYWWDKYEQEHGRCYFCRRDGGRWRSCTCDGTHRASGLTPPVIVPVTEPGPVVPEIAEVLKNAVVPVVVRREDGVQVPEKGKQRFTGEIDGGGYKKSMDTRSTKPQLQMIDPSFKRALASVLAFGAGKYSEGNWMRGMSWSEALAGMERHLDAIRMGEMMDPESGLPHIAHLACGAMFFHHYAHGPRAPEYQQFDDRLFAVKEDF